MKENDGGQEWEQFSVELESSLAEQLAVSLGEVLPGGVVLEKHYGDLFPHELESYQGPVRLVGYIPAELSREIKVKISAILERSGIGKAAFTPLESRDWATAWQDRYHPIPVGISLVVVPTWLENPYPKRIPIWMDPGMAFGSGTHPTTQLSLVLLERSLKDSLPAKVIDVGCGSGILSIGAVRLGVKKVLGVDIDPDAIRIAGANARANEVTPAVSFREGSVKEILGEDRQLTRASLVIANIITPILIELFNEGLGELVLPGGRIVLSGILKEQLPEILPYLKRAGFRLLEKEYQEDWIGLIGEKEAAQSSA